MSTAFAALAAGLLVSAIICVCSYIYPDTKLTEEE